MRAWGALVLLLCWPGWAVATTRYLSTSGSDSNSCAASTSSATPKRNFNGASGALSCMAASDTLIVRGGTYTEALDNRFMPSGVSGSPTVIQAFSGETVWLSPTSCGGGSDAVWFYGVGYQTLDGINIDASNCTNNGIRINDNGGVGAHHITVKNAEVKNAKTGACIGMAGSEEHDVTVVNVHAHHCGNNPPQSPPNHGIYLQGANNLVDGCESDHNAGHGIQAFDHDGLGDNNTVRNCALHDNGQYGIIISEGANIVAYNNKIYKNTQFGARIDFSASAPGFYYNSLWSNGQNCLYIGSGSSNATVKNNICYANTPNTISDNGTGTVLTSNITTQDPKFANTASTPPDFSLLAGSPAIDFGVTVSGISVDSVGTTRPQGGAPDAGAIEYVTAVTAATYYVTKSGSDSNTCTQAQVRATAKLTVNSALACLHAGVGDTLDIGAGTYAESIAFNAIPGGASGKPTTVQGHAGETVIFLPTTGNSSGDVVTIYDRDYVTLSNLILDGTNVSVVGLRMGGGSTYAHHHIYSNITVRNVPNNACITEQGETNNSDLQFLNLTVSACGTAMTNNTGGMGLRLTATNSLVDTCTVSGAHDHGIAVLLNTGSGASNNIIRNCTVTGNTGSGIVLASGTDNLAYRNAVYGNGLAGGTISGSATRSQFYHNVFYNNSGYCVDIVDSGESSSTVRNNICHANGTNSIHDLGTSTTKDHNTTANPNFVSTATPDFHLTAGSVAIDAGVFMTPCPSGLTCSYLGAAPDAGIYEFAATVKTYYVDPVAGNDGNAGTDLLHAFRTPHQAELATAAGDTVYFRGGTYRHSCCNNATSCPDALGAAPDGTRFLYVQHGGSAGSPITYQGYPADVAAGNYPIFQGRGWNNLDLNSDGNEDGPYIDANGSPTCASTTPPFQVTNSNNDERLVEFKQGVAYVTLRDLILTDSNRYSIYFADDPAHVTAPANHITIQGVTAKNGWSAGVHLQGNSNTIKDSVFHHMQHGNGVLLRPNDKSVTVNDAVLSGVLAYKIGYRLNGKRVQPASGDTAGGSLAHGIRVHDDCATLAGVGGAADSQNLCKRVTIVNSSVWGTANDAVLFAGYASYLKNIIALSAGGGPDAWGANATVNGSCFRVPSGLSPVPAGNVYVGNLGAWCEEYGMQLQDTAPVLLHNTLYGNGHGTSSAPSLSLLISGATVVNNLLAGNQNSGTPTEWTTAGGGSCTSCKNNLLADASGVAVGGTNLTNALPRLRNVNVFRTLTSPWRHLEVPVIGVTATSQVAHILQSAKDGTCPASNSAALGAGARVSWTNPVTGVSEFWPAFRGQEDIGWCEVGR